jgi:chlorobactene glucosyltransferase
MPGGAPPEQGAKISVLIPARNEERNIGHAIETLLADPWPNFEILILDDQSEDETARIVNAWAKKDQRVRLIRGKALPPGWLGKSHACDQLAREARGGYLFFSDADTTFHPGILEFCLRSAAARNADLLTGLPRLWSPSFWGRVIMPNVYFLYFGFLSVPLLSSRFFRRHAFGLGSFLFFKKEAYGAIGGHEAIRLELTEDVGLAKRVKGAGLRFRLVDPSRYLESKMYESFREIWLGYGKNLFKALGSSLGVLSGFVILFSALYLAPFYFLVSYASAGVCDIRLLAVAGQIALALCFRLLLALRYRLSLESVILHPLSIALMLAIGVNSARLLVSGKGYEWKGRRVR